MPAPIDASVSSKVNEIKAQPYAKWIPSEELMQRNFGFRIIRQQVSSGKNSVVYKCEHIRLPECYCVVKSYKFGKDKIEAALKKETCQIMRYVSRKCAQLLTTHEIFYTNEKIYLFCDWAARGEVLMNLKNHSVKLNEAMLKDWTTDILNAVNFLHSNAICHRNIGPATLLLTQDNRVRLGSLSDACIYSTPDGTLLRQTWARFSMNSNWNQAPEVAKNKEYDPRRADIWSIGATVFWLITRHYPIKYKVNSKLTKQLEMNMQKVRNVSAKCQTFVRKMLAFQPTARPTITEALQLEWISGAVDAAAKEPVPEVTLTQQDQPETTGPDGETEATDNGPTSQQA